jgi:hypothetical protein
MNIEELTLKDIRELQSLVGGKREETPSEPSDLGIRIVILQRGWVMVGQYIQTGEYVTLKRAAVVRKWGTTKGLPELAQKGPLSDTIIDKGPDVRFHALTEIASLACEESAWSGKL